jgi:hypothetical protein
MTLMSSLSATSGSFSWSSDKAFRAGLEQWTVMGGAGRKDEEKVMLKLHARLESYEKFIGNL